MNPRFLLEIAESLCGRDSRRRVFDALVADWHRESVDAHGVQRLRVTVSGAAAFGWSLIRCMDVAYVTRSRPTAAPVAALASLSIIAAAVSLQPLQYAWRHWAPTTPMIWWTPRRNVLYLAPQELAIGLAFALLPAVILLIVAGASARRVTTIVACALAATVIVDGWDCPECLGGAPSRLLGPRRANRSGSGGLAVRIDCDGGATQHRCGRGNSVHRSCHFAGTRPAAARRHNPRCARDGHCPHTSAARSVHRRNHGSRMVDVRVGELSPAGVLVPVLRERRAAAAFPCSMVAACHARDDCSNGAAGGECRRD